MLSYYERAYTLIIIGFLLLSDFAVSQVWEVQDSRVSVELFDVYFVDENHGWAIGDSTTIISTSDGGKNWHVQSSPVDNVRFRRLQFVNENVGYIVGNDGAILSTIDGGIVWRENESGVDYVLKDISFINPDTGWIAANDVSPTRKGVILHTTDGGNSWKIQLEPYFPNNPDIPILVGAVEFIDEENGWVLASDYFDNFSSTYVYLTRDGGENWDIAGVLPAHPMSNLSVAALDTVWAGGIGFARSTDGGYTWLEELWGVWDITQYDVNTDWLITSSITGTNIIFTEDGGETWTEILTDQIPGVKALSNVGKNLIWAVGDSGIVMHYTGGDGSVTNGDAQTPRKFKLKQNYPNPFNSSTTIQFQLNRTESVTLLIYDLKGRKISRLLSQMLSPGIYSVNWDGRDNLGKLASSGVYFYELQAGDVSLRRKALLLR